MNTLSVLATREILRDLQAAERFMHQAGAESTVSTVAAIWIKTALEQIDHARDRLLSVALVDVEVETIKEPTP